MGAKKTFNVHGAPRSRSLRGGFHDGTPRTDVSGLIRRMVKENLLKFDGKPLFPERQAYTMVIIVRDGNRAIPGG